MIGTAALVFFFCVLFLAKGATIPLTESPVRQGGPLMWSDVNSWVEGVVPGAGKGTLLLLTPFDALVV